MDRVAAMVIALGVMLLGCLFLLALFSIAPIFSSVLAVLIYIVLYFLFNEEHEIHHAQEFENRFWTIYFALLVGASIYVKDSPFCFGDEHPYVGLFVVFVVGYGVHMWDRIIHRKEMSQQGLGSGLRRGASAAQSLARLNALGMPVEDQLERISACMENIDQLLVPSTINNLIHQPFIMRNEREIISIFEDAQPKALNWLISHVKLALVFYKIKDHRNFRGQHRTELIELLAVDRISALTVKSRVLLLRALQLMKLTANPRAEHWVRNIILSTHLDELSELKTMSDSKGDYFCMNKLIYEDIRSETVRQDILSHLKKEANVARAHLENKTRKSKQMRERAWRKILSDVDDTLTCSGGSYPAGIDKRYGKKVVYPGVIGLYRELDLGTTGPEEFPPNTVGNLVFLSARPHLYKDISEKHNFAKFDKLRQREGVDGRGGLHTIPSLLAGDLTSGREFMMTGDFEPLARKKFDNFRKFVSIYPEYKHFFICDNGQGDVRAGELMFDHFPGQFGGLFVHLVKDLHLSYGFDAERWRKKNLLKKTCFFTSYPDAALYAATRDPPLIRMSALRRICQDSVADFHSILPSQWSSESQQRERRSDLNQSLWRCNRTLIQHDLESIPLIDSPRKWENGQKVQTTFGVGIIMGFDPVFDLYDVELDWRPLDEQIKDVDHDVVKKDSDASGKNCPMSSKLNERTSRTLQTVEEEDESNYLSPATSFDASKHSSKQSLPGMDREHSGRSLPETVNENEPILLSPSHTCADGDAFSFDAVEFDRNAASPEPTLEDTTVSYETPVATSKNVQIKKVVSCLPSNGRTKETEARPKHPTSKGKHRARISGRNISKYTAPKLPKLKDDKNRSKFSFWSTNSLKGTVDNFEAVKSKSKSILSAGERVATPYGLGIVVEHRKKSSIIVVDLSGPWKARAYLIESVVTRDSSGFFGSILRQFSTTGDRQASPRKKSSKAELEFPHSVGAAVHTPFGEGTITRPLPPKTASSSTPKLSSSLSRTASSEVRTIAISLNSWTLRDGSHPILYCTSDAGKEWKVKNTVSTSNHHRESSLFSVIGTLVSGTVESLKKIRVPREIEAPPIKAEAPKFERYYKDGAAVATSYGDGMVCSFRASDGFYTVKLIKCGHVFATAHLQDDSMSYRLAKGCVEGYPVLTRFGSGVLHSVNPTTGVHNVTIPSYGAVLYLQPDQVIRPLKAAVGEDVSTPYGEGKVLKYRLFDDIYEVKLSWGNAVLYATAKTFDRIDDRMEDKGGFGMNWILQFFYSREESKEAGPQRSRSNSFSMLSQSGVSVKSVR
ncbi:hypothetical protein HJC23_012486 [Cyclotella cryptica]|uniref:Uncharacterized protein n=1 Tax=Cyclotella cryptica TaxID=29204 RepID=A0ABD3P9S6_9STRA|eukprot:CCRYP_016298-RA/>CCRYP_016298-RA protein AED:0.18 eAED:0.18 QI:379/1/1/1/1/1/4/1381/1295